MSKVPVISGTADGDRTFSRNQNQQAVANGIRGYKTEVRLRGLEEN